MPEILTESFCERCGTRYTFESAVPRAARLKGIKVISRGLKNFVMSDDTSMDEAMAAARSETDREATSQQLDAFHKTFNFCMSCRQYTCGNCWNEADGQCLSCSPHLGHEILPAPFPGLDATAGVAVVHAGNGTNGTNGHVDEGMATMAWPTSDLMRDAESADAADLEAGTEMEPIEQIDAAARLAALGATVGEAPPESPVEVPVEVADGPTDGPTDEPVVAAAADEPAVDLTETDARAAAAAGQTSDLLRRFRPGQNLDDEIAAYERSQAAAAALAAGGGVTGGIAAEEAAAVETEGAASDAPAGAPKVDVVPQPTWQVVAPDAPTAHGLPAPASPAPAPVAEPQWPTQPEWPSQRPAGGLPFMSRSASPNGGLESLWAESAREVVAAVPVAAAAKPASGVAPCVSCGLSLSATARFCRRCGTRQG